MLDKDHLLKLKKLYKTLEPTIRIGKNGITTNTYPEIIKVLKKKSIVKIKILKNCEEDKEELIKKITIGTGSVLIHKIGKVFTLYKKGKYRNDSNY